METQLSGKLPLRSHSPPDFWQILDFQERQLGLSLYASLSFLNSFPLPLRSPKEFMQFFGIKKYQKPAHENSIRTLTVKDSLHAPLLKRKTFTPLPVMCGFQLPSQYHEY